MATGANPYVRPANYEDCKELAPRLRQADVKELKYSCGKEPLQALQASFSISEKAWAVIYKDKVIALFGLVRRADIGVPWMMASDELKEIQKSFLSECKNYLNEMSEGCSLLTNYVWVGNTVHIKWLKWLGFTFLEPIEYGVARKPFIQFYMELR